MIGRYLTADTIRLGLTGVAAGVLAGFAWRLAGRVRWSGIPVVLAVLVATRYAGRSDWFRWSGAVGAGVLITVLGGLGAGRLLADPSIGWAWVAAGAMVSAAGVWAGVPETGPAVLVGAALGGLATACIVTRSAWGPTAGIGAAAVLGWAALSGAVGRPWAAVGGALCMGVAPWFAVQRWLPAWPRSRAAGPWLLGAHAALVILAARWIGVVPQAGWRRVAVVALAGLAVSAATRPRASWTGWPGSSDSW